MAPAYRMPEQLAYGATGSRAGSVPPDDRIVLTKPKEVVASFAKKDFLSPRRLTPAGPVVRHASLVHLACRFLQLCENHPAVQQHPLCQIGVFHRFNGSVRSAWA